MSYNNVAQLQWSAIAWLYEEISNISTVTAIVAKRIYSEIAPQEAKRPYIVCQQLDPHNVQGGFGQTLLGRRNVLVKAVTDGNSFAPANNIMTLIDAELPTVEECGSIVVGGKTFAVYCVSGDDVMYPEINAQNGERYNHFGIKYQIVTQEVP